MYNPASKKAEEFINHEEILATLNYAEENKHNEVPVSYTHLKGCVDLAKYCLTTLGVEEDVTYRLSLACLLYTSSIYVSLEIG